MAVGADAAALAKIPEKNEVFTKGGIELGAKFLNLKEQGNGVSFNFPVDFDQPETANYNGIAPIVVKVEPLRSLPLFLGLDGKSIEELAKSSS